jgi:predicted Zn finger-like uncharacterized protein
MKIICDSCGTKYSISDDKVRGKVFKIRCKKCSHIIVVRGGEAATEAAAQPAVEGGWHIVVDGEQVGPIPEGEVRERIERGEIKADTYAWKEGFADWMKLSAVPEFSGVVGGDSGANVDPFASVGATNGTDRSRRPSGAGQSLFGGASVEVESDAFAAPARGGGGDLFAAASAAPAASAEPRWPSSGNVAAGHDGGRVENLTGQRHENSVLFSLSNLQSLAVPSTKPAASLSTTAPTPDGSGLIDIKAMAAATGMGGLSPETRSSSSSSVDDLPSFSSFAPQQPILLQPQSSGPPKWIYAVIGLLVVFAGGIGVLAWKVMTAKSPLEPERVVVQVPVPTPAPIAARPPEETAKPSTIPDDKLPPREGGEAKSEGKGEGKSEGKGEGKSEGKSDRHHKSSKGDKADAKSDSKSDGKSGDSKAEQKRMAEDKKAGAQAAALIAEKKPAKGSLEDLLNEASPTRKGSSHGGDDDKKGGGEGASAGPLAKNAVVAGMNSVKGKVNECYTQYKVPGMAMVNVVIGKNGKVSTATVTGKFAGTPTGSCVEKAVKTASFPPSDGLSTPYPFQLK